MAKPRHGRKSRRAEAERSAANTLVPSWITANLTEFPAKQRHDGKHPANDPPCSWRSLCRAPLIQYGAFLKQHSAHQQINASLRSESS